MENLENSPLLRLLNRKHNHSAKSKTKGSSKLSLRKNEAQKMKLNDELSVRDSEVQKSNVEDKKYQSTVGYLKSKDIPLKKQLFKFVHTKRPILVENTVESVAGKSDVTCFSKSNERQLFHRTFTEENMNLKCSENSNKYFDSWETASLSKASKEFTSSKTKLQSTSTENNSSELLSCNISSTDSSPNEVSPENGNEFCKENGGFLNDSEKPSNDLYLCVPSNISNPLLLSDGSLEVINFLKDREIDENNSIYILSSSSESLSDLEKVHRESVAFDLICSNFPTEKSKKEYDQEPKHTKFFKRKGKQNDSFGSSPESSTFTTKEEFPTLNMLECSEKSSVANSNSKIKSFDEICEQIYKLDINTEGSYASAVYSQEQFPFEYMTEEKDYAKCVLPTEISDQGKEKQPAKSTNFTFSSAKKLQLQKDFLSSDEDQSPLPLSQRITTNVVSISENEASRSLSKLHLNALSSSSEEFEEFLEKLKTPVVSKTKTLSNNNPPKIVSQVKTDIPARKILATLSDVVKSKITNKSFGASPDLPIKTLRTRNLPSERRKISFSSDEDDTSDEVFTPAAETTALKQDEAKKNRKSPIKYSFLASLSTIAPESKANPEALIYRKNFGSRKDELVKKLFTLYNSQIFSNKLPLDMKITWNPRMRKTAGFCYYKKDSSCPLGRSARVELAPKVIDSPDRLRDTLVHELCHAAAWLIHGYRDGHGTIWKYWACRVSQVFPELPAVSRCHSYDIVTKYIYKCTGCGGQIGRHSKSIDITKKVCGKCHSHFELFVNGKPSSSSCTPKGFALFVKENYGEVKKNHNNIKHAEIMKILSKEFSSKAKMS